VIGARIQIYYISPKKKRERERGEDTWYSFYTYHLGNEVSVAGRIKDRNGLVRRLHELEGGQGREGGNVFNSVYDVYI